MAPLGALSQAWVAAEAALPHGWSITGLWRFGDDWIALSERRDRSHHQVVDVDLASDRQQRCEVVHRGRRL